MRDEVKQALIEAIDRYLAEGSPKEALERAEDLQSYLESVIAGLKDDVARG